MASNGSAQPVVPVNRPLHGRNLAVAEKAKGRIETAVGTCSGLARGLGFVKVDRDGVVDLTTRT